MPGVTLPAPLDAIDQQLVGLLSRNGRMTNRSLAEAVGLTDVTVATRIRRLVRDEVISVGPQFDWKAAGFERQAVCRIRVAMDPPHIVGERLLHIGGILFNTVTFGGDADLFLILIAADQVAMTSMLAEIEATQGVDHVETTHLNEVFSYRSFGAKLPFTRIPLDELPRPCLQLDALDRTIIEMLREDGRASARGIARRTDVSDVTVSTRLGRMEDAGLLRVTALVDPTRTGQISGLAHFSLTPSGENTELKHLISGMPMVTYCATVTGGHELIGALATRSERRMFHVVTDELWRLPGVASVKAWHIVEMLSLRADLARLV